MEGTKTIDYGGIGWAVNHMRHGHKMRRRMWQNIEWVAYVPQGATQIPQKFANAHPSGDFLVAKAKDGGLVPWTATQADLLAGDWEMQEPTQPGEYHATPRSPEQAQVQG
jgi:hypothetical protein